MAVLEVTDLKKSYKVGFIPKKQLVLKGLSFKVEPGKITGFLGGNGAGKTTTMKCMLGLAYPDAGEVKFFGKSKLDADVKSRIGFLPERPYFYEYLTGVEFLLFYGRLSGDTPKSVLMERIERLLKRVDLWHAKDKKLRGYSKGMLQKIGLAQALIHDPEFVILDEPMSGLDPDGRFYVAEIIKETAKEGKSVFLSSHLLPDVERLCEDLVILRQGVGVFHGTTEDFLKKMGSDTTISYFQSGHKKQVTVNTEDDLQKEISKLVSDGCTIVDVKRDTNLEDAFIRVGLRGDE